MRSPSSSASARYSRSTRRRDVVLALEFHQVGNAAAKAIQRVHQRNRHLQLGTLVILGRHDDLGHVPLDIAPDAEHMT